MSHLDTSVRERPDLDLVHTLPALPTSSRHVSLTDRVSLRLGLWLLLRTASRVQHQSEHATHADRLRLERERETRELAARTERQLWLL